MTEAGKRFIQIALSRNALVFGNFRLKSGRRSRYFFNLGALCDGEALSEIGRLYSAAIISSGIEFDILFGPAYKGIPLVSVTAVSLMLNHHQNKAVAYNRKETKDHGEGGQLAGAPLSGRRVLILDDVITAGTAIRESMMLIEKAGGIAAGVVICFDRKEKGPGEESAIEEIRQQHGVEVISISDFDDLLEAVDPDERVRLTEAAVANRG